MAKANPKTEAAQNKPAVDEDKQLKVGSGGLAVAEEFIDESDFAAGMENTDKDSFAIPFLMILQKMSPLVDEDNVKHVEGAKAGMIYNTVTQDLFDGKTGLLVVPCAYKRSFVCWGGRDNGGGFKGEYAVEDVAEMVKNGAIVNVEGRLYKPNEDGTVNPKKNDYYADTRTHFVITIDEETGEQSQAIVALAGTATKASRILMTLMQQKKVDTPNGRRTPPTFANLVRLTTIGQSNDKGSWSAPKFELEGMVKDRALYEDARSFYKAFNGGGVKADFSKADNNHSDDGGVGETPEEADKF